MCEQTLPDNLGYSGRICHGVPDNAICVWVDLTDSEYARITGQGPDSLRIGKTVRSCTRFPAWAWSHADRVYFAVYRDRESFPHKPAGDAEYTFWYILGRLTPERAHQLIGVPLR